MSLLVESGAVGVAGHAQLGHLGDQFRRRLIAGHLVARGALARGHRRVAVGAQQPGAGRGVRRVAVEAGQPPAHHLGVLGVHLGGRMAARAQRLRRRLEQPRLLGTVGLVAGGAGARLERRVLDRERGLLPGHGVAGIAGHLGAAAADHMGEIARVRIVARDAAALAEGRVLVLEHRVLELAVAVEAQGGYGLLEHELLGEPVAQVAVAALGLRHHRMHVLLLEALLRILVAVVAGSCRGASGLGRRHPTAAGHHGQRRGDREDRQCRHEAARVRPSFSRSHRGLPPAAVVSRSALLSSGS